MRELSSCLFLFLFSFAWERLSHALLRFLSCTISHSSFFLIPDCSLEMAYHFISEWIIWGEDVDLCTLADVKQIKNKEMYNIYNHFVNADFYYWMNCICIPNKEKQTCAFFCLCSRNFQIYMIFFFILFFF